MVYTTTAANNDYEKNVITISFNYKTALGLLGCILAPSSQDMSVLQLGIFICVCVYKFLLQSVHNFF